MNDSPRNPYEHSRLLKISRNQQLLHALNLPETSRELFPVRRFNIPNRARSTKPTLPRRCGHRLAAVPKPNYAESSPAALALRSQLLSRLRNPDMTSNSTQQPAQQSTEQQNASALGFTEVDGVWTHTDYKQELVQAVMDYLEEECINLLKLKDLRGYGNRDMIMDRFERRFESPVGMLVYMKERILALDESSSEEKAAKRTKTAFEQARKVMKSELDNLGFKDIEDYGDMEWGTFKIEHPEKLESVLNARAKVLMAFSLKEDRLQGVKILCDFWHNRGKKHVENLKARGFGRKR
ncbi:TPA: hypothetical protein ACH3X1_004992 [Trebouxia sp. C0004]